MRIIDADALIESLTINPTECMGCPEPEWIDEFIQVLNTAPSVLINCIQCKNYYETEDDNGVVGHCKMDAAHAVKHSTAYMHDDLYEAISIRIPSADRPTNTPTDLISRTDAIERFCECGTSLERQGKTIITMVDAKYAFIETLESLPSAEPNTGEWILVCDSEGEGDNLYRCSECGCEYGCQEYDKPNFCLDCGAKMFKKDGEFK